MSAPISVIRSSRNSLLKRVRSVSAGKLPELVLLEGRRLVQDALDARWPVDTLLVSDERLDAARELVRRGYAPRVVEDGLLAAVSRLDTCPGVLALASAPADLGPSVLPRDGEPLVVVVCGIADPGNLGALARTAEAAGAAALVVLDGGVSPWNEKALRGSMGSLLRLPVWRAQGSEHVRASLADRGYRSIRAATRGGASYRELDYSGKLALWVSGETGDAPAAMDGIEPVTIPMAQTVESLNAATAAAVLLFAAGRIDP